MKLRKLIFLIPFFILSGCGQNKEPLDSFEGKVTSNTEIEEGITSKSQDNKAGKDKQTELAENEIRLKFQEFTLEIDSIYAWDEDNKLKQIQSDTAVVYLELGESIEGKIIRINQVKDGDLKIYQRFENSVTVMDEGPHCDLTEWKHYDSDWKEIKVSDGKFLTNSYSENDWGKFIEVDMNELREAVRKQCGDRWAEHIKDVNSPNDYPCGISMSRIFLKIFLTNKNDGIVKERIISFVIPTGC